MDDAGAVAVVERAGVDATPEAVERAGSYLRRVRRGRWLGLLLGLLAGFGPLAGEDQLSLVLPRLFAGYLLGLLAAELLSPPPVRTSVRVASMEPRSSADLLPLAGRLLPWLLLTPVLAAPLLALGTHPRGVSRSSNGNGSCFGSGYWPQTATLITVAGLGAGALLATTLIVRRLASRAQPADDPAMLVLDRALRARSARSAVAAATALGCALIFLLGESVYQGVHSYDCSRPPGLYGGYGNVYSWSPSVGPWLQSASQALFVAALPLWLICQHLPLPARTRRAARR
jgi:hypothetical protein